MNKDAVFGLLGAIGVGLILGSVVLTFACINISARCSRREEEEAKQHAEEEKGK